MNPVPAFRSPVKAREVFLQRCSVWMSSCLSADWKCWLATCEGRIVGQVWLHVIEKLPNPGTKPERHGYITNLYAKPEI